MATFENAIDYVLVNECGPKFSAICTTDNDGGLVKFGLNTRSNPDLLTKYGSHLERMDLAAAKLEYKARYWQPIMDQLVSQRVATKVLDMMVNQGIGDGINHLQLAVGIPHTTAHFGPVTLGKANALAEDTLLAALVEKYI